MTWSWKNRTVPSLTRSRVRRAGRAVGVTSLAVAVAAGGVLTAAPAVADHPPGGFPVDNCVVEPTSYREDLQILVDIFVDDEIDKNPFHLDNDGNGIACDDGTNSVPNDPARRSIPLGRLDSVTPGAGEVRVTGWSFDPDVPRWSNPVHIYVDGRGAAVVARAKVPRVDVDSAHGVGTDHGFDLSVAVTPGTHRVCAYGLNYGPLDGNPSLGCRTVQVPASAQLSPVGRFDTLHFFPDGSPVTYGWAADPEAVTRPLEIHVWVDGVRSYGFLTGTHNRPDVLAATGAPNAGYLAILPPQGPGRHRICAYAINVGPTGSNTLLGCKTYG